MLSGGIKFSSGFATGGIVPLSIGCDCFGLDFNVGVLWSPIREARTVQLAIGILTFWMRIGSATILCVKGSTAPFQTFVVSAVTCVHSYLMSVLVRYFKMTRETGASSHDNSPSHD